MGGVSRWFLQGVLQIFGVFVVVNCGEFVVDCVVDRGGLCGGFSRRKICHFLEIFLWISLWWSILGRWYWGNGIDDGSDAAECAVDMVGFAADGAGGHAGGDDRGFDTAEVQVGEGPVTGEVKVGEVGVVGGEAMGGRTGEAEDVEFGGVDVDAEELGVEVGLLGVVDAFD